MLYLTLGFRQFSHYFTDIRDALERGDEAEARRLLAEWRHLDASELPRTELLRHVIEHSLLAAHRHVFGVFFWFVRAVDASASGRPARCCTAWPSSPAATGPSRAAPSARRPTSACWQLLAAPVRPDRPRAGAADGLRLRGGRQLRGGGDLLAARRRAVEARQRRHHPRRRGRRGGRATRRQRRAGRRRRTAPRPSTAGAAPEAAGAEGSHARRCRPSSATCAASSAWSGARWCCGCCCWRCCRWPTWSADGSLSSATARQLVAGSRRRCGSRDGADLAALHAPPARRSPARAGGVQL